MPISFNGSETLEMLILADCTVARLMAEMPEIGRLSNKRISKLAGLAPLACDSGQRKGKRSSTWRTTHDPGDSLRRGCWCQPS